ncbi:MAG TPA: 30S ribosomal protein S6 [Desulfobacterales bacterium]|nr:30S ribosomal protein S6 [Desulfobacterales bacterium]
MRRYETFIIIDPDLSEEQRLPVLERVKEIMAQLSGFLIRIDDWGSRKLSYAVKKKERGYYVRFDFCGTGQLVNEMERFFRIDERVLKHMSVLLDAHPDLERIKEEMAKAEEEAQKTAATAPVAIIEPAAAATAPVAIIETAATEAAQPTEPVPPQQEA